MTDLNRYKKIVNDIETWLDSVEKYEQPLREIGLEVDSYKQGSPKYMQTLHGYTELAKNVEYIGYKGLDAFHEARLDLKLFKKAVDRIPKLKLRDPRAFDRRYTEKLSECDSNWEAWMEVEEEYKSVFGENKYASFNSFQTTRSHRVKRRQIA